MLKIKLTRRGKKNESRYRIVINEARSKRDGDYLDLLGYYDPSTQPPTFRIDLEKYQQWLKKGAKPTPTIKKLTEKKIRHLKPAAKSSPKKISTT